MSSSRQLPHIDRQDGLDSDLHRVPARDLRCRAKRQRPRRPVSWGRAGTAGLRTTAARPVGLHCRRRGPRDDGPRQSRGSRRAADHPPDAGGCLRAGRCAGLYSDWIWVPRWFSRRSACRRWRTLKANWPAPGRLRVSKFRTLPAARRATPSRRSRTHRAADPGGFSRTGHVALSSWRQRSLRRRDLVRWGGHLAGGGRGSGGSAFGERIVPRRGQLADLGDRRPRRRARPHSRPARRQRQASLLPPGPGARGRRWHRGGLGRGLGRGRPRPPIRPARLRSHRLRRPVIGATEPDIERTWELLTTQAGR